MTVNATVLAAGECTASVNSVYFGNITPPITTDIQVTYYQTNVTCPDQTPYTISAGTGIAGSYATRLMSGVIIAGAVMEYNLYTDDLFTTVWGDGSAGTAVLSNIGNAASQPNYFHALIPAQSTPDADDYVDTVEVVVTY